MTERSTVKLVIRLLGAVAILLVTGALVLTWRLVEQAGEAGAADPVAVGAVGAVWTAASSTLGALGALLVSTRSEPDAAQEPPAEPVPPA